MDRRKERISRIQERYEQQDQTYDMIEPKKELDETLVSQSDIQDSECYKIFQQQFAQNNQTTQSSSQQSEANSFHSVILTREDFNRLEPNVRRHYIFNQDTGEVYDSRNGEVVKSILHQHSKPVSNVKLAWKDFWSKSKRLNEALLDAAETGDEKAVIKYLDEGKSGAYVDINAKGLDDWTALHFASNEASIAVVRILCERGANIEALTRNKRTALHLATQRGSLEITQILCEFKANVNAQDNEFNTPLHVASLLGHHKLVNFLLTRKADHSIKNHQNVVALNLGQNSQVLKVFESFGIKPSCGDYVRTQLPGTNAVLQNGRNDHITRFLQLGNNKSVKPQQKEEHKHQVSLKKFKFEQLNIQSSHSLSIDHPQYNSQQDKISYKDFVFYALLGKGSFGEVYLVEKIGQIPKKQYAMKILKKDRMISQNLMRYAQTEKNVLSIMQHPFIVGLNYAFQTEMRLFLAMDFCPGGDLSTLLDIKRKLPEEVAKIYVAEILLALGALHENCIIFRDLKPENVVLDEDGHAMLTDFGLSKMGVQEGVANRSFCGSPAYLPPEILNRQGHNRQVDWYLLGVMTYELLVGIPPYYATEREQLFENIKKGPLKMPRNLSVDAKDFIVSLLNRDPMKRLGAKRDADEIREHPWLKNINWLECIERKLKPPKPERKTFSNVPMNINFDGDNEEVNKIEKWTFIDEVQV